MSEIQSEIYSAFLLLAVAAACLASIRCNIVNSLKGKYNNKPPIMYVQLDPISQYDIAQQQGPVALANAPSALVVPINRPF